VKPHHENCLLGYAKYATKCSDIKDNEHKMKGMIGGLDHATCIEMAETELTTCTLGEMYVDSHEEHSFTVMEQKDRKTSELKFTKNTLDAAHEGFDLAYMARHAPATKEVYHKLRDLFKRHFKVVENEFKIDLKEEEIHDLIDKIYALKKELGLIGHKRDGTLHEVITLEGIIKKIKDQIAEMERILKIKLAEEGEKEVEKTGCHTKSNRLGVDISVLGKEIPELEEMLKQQHANMKILVGRRKGFMGDHQLNTKHEGKIYKKKQPALQELFDEEDDLFDADDFFL